MPMQRMAELASGIFDNHKYTDMHYCGSQFIEPQFIKPKLKITMNCGFI